MADARIDIYTLKRGRALVIAECPAGYARRTGGVLQGEGAVRDALTHAVRGHIEWQCPPGGCPLSTLVVADA